MTSPYATPIEGDCLEVMAGMPAESVDAIVTDPPYGISFLGREWDHGVPGVPFWEAALRVARPGAHLLAFGGTRTSHRLACAIEDAGWEIRDSLCWLYGAGMPKGLNISKQIDKMAGAEREVVGSKVGWPGYSDKGDADGEKWSGGLNNPKAECAITAPATEAARQWDGWNTSLKPSYEPILVCRKPFKNTVAANVLEHGCGALNIAATRIGTTEFCKPRNVSGHETRENGSVDTDWSLIGGGSGGGAVHPGGRWPANVVLSHTSMCRCVGTKKVKGIKIGSPRPKDRAWSKGWKDVPEGFDYADPDGTETVAAFACSEDCPVRALDEQAGERGGKWGRQGETADRRDDYYSGGKFGRIAGHVGEEFIGDRGGPSRFFFCPKASPSERGDFNSHPTVKPINLMRWLVRLVTRPGGLVLDPFMGSGSTLLACLDEGMDAIGVDNDPASVAIARRRLEDRRATTPLFA